jgi:hypothetical protein
VTVADVRHDRRRVFSLNVFDTSAAMNMRLTVLWCLILFVLADPGSRSLAATALPAGLAGRYSDNGNPATVIDIRADGTCSVGHAPQSVSGTYTFEDNKFTLNMAGNQPVVFQVTNGVLTAPDGMQLRRTGEAVPAPVMTREQFEAMRERGRIAKSMNNIKRLCIGCKIWATDHQGAFPDNPQQLMDPEILGKGPDGKSADVSVFHCPLLNDDTQPGYLYLGKGHKEGEAGDVILFVSRWQDATGRRIVGHANLAVTLEVAKLDNSATAASTAPVKPAPGQNAPPAAGPAGTSQIWHLWNAMAVPKAHPMGESFQLTFTNRRPSPVKIYWLSPKGERTYYWDIPPGGSKLQGVKPGAVWMATDSADVPLGYFQIGEKTSLAVIPER